MQPAAPTPGEAAQGHSGGGHHQGVDMNMEEKREHGRGERKIKMNAKYSLFFGNIKSQIIFIILTFCFSKCQQVCWGWAFNSEGPSYVPWLPYGPYITSSVCNWLLMEQSEWPKPYCQYSHNHDEGIIFFQTYILNVWHSELPDKKLPPATIKKIMSW